MHKKDINIRNEVFPLYWKNPRTKTTFPAGVAFYQEEYGEFHLKIDEEPSEKRYYLKPIEASEEKVKYRMELVMKDKDGKFLRRQTVGKGSSHENEISVNYGSKYKDLVLDLREKK